MIFVYASALVLAISLPLTWLAQNKARKKVLSQPAYDAHLYRWNVLPVYNRCGCYVWFVSDNSMTPIPGDASTWTDIYVGQSTDMNRRFFQHYQGMGNKPLYHAIFHDHRGAAVIFLPCKAKAMNRMEIRLIRAFHARRSFNTAKGGGNKLNPKRIKQYEKQII